MRDYKIDILRFVGLAMIILAHSGPPGSISQLRNFDVPLMVLISGLSFGLSYKAGAAYGSYVWKRVKRLVFPVWIFLTVYFIGHWLIDANHPTLEQRNLLLSYGLIGGIGYVWIIRVFLLVALVAPFIYALHKNTRSQMKFFFTVIAFLLSYEALRYVSLPHIQEGAGWWASWFTHYLAPYAIIFAIGLRLPTLTRNQAYRLATACLITFISICMFLYFYTGEIVHTQEFKYPPAIYYFSYALFVSVFLWLQISPIEYVIDRIGAKAAVLFVAQNSIWVYLWHIPIVEAVENKDVSFAVKYVFVFLSASVLTYFQVMLIRKLSTNEVGSDSFRHNMRTLFTG